MKNTIRLKVVSYNIHKGFSSLNLKFILKKIREALQVIHPDVVLLQEVLGRQEIHQRLVKGWPEQTQFEYLAHELWPHFTYGKNAVYSAGHHGNAILSKHPIVFSENIDVSTNRLEKRGLLHGVIQLPGIAGEQGKHLHLVCVHLGLVEAERMQQIGMLCKRIDSHVPHGHPLLIGGDFNDWRGVVSHALERRLEMKEAFITLYGHPARTFPSWLPTLRLDRIYYRGVLARSAKCLNGRPWSQLSDHAAVMAEFF